MMAATDGGSDARVVISGVFVDRVGHASTDLACLRFGARGFTTDYFATPPPCLFIGSVVTTPPAIFWHVPLGTSTQA